ncbi:MAG: hypothetical protein DCF25_13115 [Leptolyngbya foveolarum]|uniref:DUF4351 domain-containing protein n=1 Tax=Leptolyngbya foveolarum TaxID=47253 RepID=A0A2W4U9Q2_9CYAN|nr:MAG: hypothetical protein DCF25_13115 [Leptolyngbya foveolarum]
MFDFTCKYLVENFSTDFATWLLGKPIKMTRLEPTELSLEPLRADSVIFLQAENIILHLEFQTRADPKMPFRMLDYCVRLHRQFPDKELRQFVIYLKPSRAASVYQDVFELPRTRHEFDAIRLWEQPAEQFLSDAGLLPFAPLAQAENKTVVLQEVATKINQIADIKLRGNLSTSTGILSALVLDQTLVRTILGRNIMQDSPLYQSILSEGLVEGLERGRQQGRELGLEQGLEQGREQGLEQGREQERRELLLELLAMKLGELPEEISKSVQTLSKSHLSDLKSALFSFETTANLAQWIQARQ